MATNKGGIFINYFDKLLLIDELSKAGVHGEYLNTLKALKAEIKEYVDYADAKLAKGAHESDLTLFSSISNGSLSIIVILALPK